MGGDGFFKAFFIAVFIILFLAGAIMIMQMNEELENKSEIRKYLDTKGKTPVPRSWREKMGKGI